MGKINIKNGTPIGSASVCESCCYAQIMRGYRESELLVYCNFPTPSMIVPFKLTECSRSTFRQVAPSPRDSASLASLTRMSLRNLNPSTNNLEAFASVRASYSSWLPQVAPEPYYFLAIKPNISTDSSYLVDSRPNRVVDI